MRTPRTIPLPTFTRVVATAATGLLLASAAAAGAQVLDGAPGGADRPVVVAGSPAPAPPLDGLADAVSDTASSATSGGDETAERQVEQERAAEEARERRAEERRRVRGVQERLAELGWYDGDTDGIAGPATEQAVRGFQRASSLSVDGVVGPATERALQDPDATTRAAWKASRPDPSPNSGTSGTSGSSGTSGTSSSASSSSSGSSGSASSACDLQCRGRRIVDMAPLSAPSGYTIDVRPGRSGYLGMTHGAPRREIVLWVRDSLTDRQMAATLLHEIGHAYDFEGLGGRGEDARRRWASSRGFSYEGRDAWFGNGCSSCSDYSIGAGDLAESVHACWAPGWDTFRSQMAGPPTSSQCDLLASVLR